MTDEEKRKKPRIQKQYYAQINIFGAAEWQSVTLLNLSSGGMAFLHTVSVKEGSIIKAKINFPPADGQVEVKGHVIRSTPRSVLFNVVVVFIDISEKHAALIDQFAAQWFPLR